MFSRLIAAVLGIAAMALAPAVSAAFPEDFVPRSAASSASNESSVSSTESSTVSSGTGAAASSASSAAAEEATENSDDGVGEMAKLAAQQQLTRAQFTALIVEKLYPQTELDRCYWDITSPLPPDFTLLFTDVHVNDHFAKHICIAMRDGLVKGYSDGSFRPEKKITFAESAKIIARGFALTPYADVNRLQPWYREYVEALDARNAIPTSISRMDHLVTAAEAAEMYTRLARGITSLPSRSYNDLHPKPRRTVIPVKPRPASAPAPSSVSSSVSSVQTSSAGVSSESSSSKKSFWNLF